MELDQDNKELAEEIGEQEEGSEVKVEEALQEVEKMDEDASTTRPKRARAGIKMSKLGKKELS